MKRNYWNLKNWRVKDWIGLTVILIMCLTGSFLITQYDKHLNDKRHAQEQAQAQRLIDKRLASSQQQNQPTPHHHNHLDHTPEHPTHNHKDNTTKPTDHGTHTQVRYISNDEITIHTYRYKDGIYKGLTYPDAYKTWQSKRKEIQRRLVANSQTARELGKASIDSADTELSLILTAFKSMPPAELELAKNKILKEHPNRTDMINSFFNDLANHETTKPFEEILIEYETLLESRQPIQIAADKNNAEFDNIKLELNQVDTEKPEPPTID